MSGIIRPSAAGLEVTAIGKQYRPEAGKVLIQQTEANLGGNTSVRNTDRAHLDWKEQGYFQRNRDLGQVFTVEEDFRLEGIVLRTGPSDGAVLAGAPGAKVFVQFFEVLGTPRIHDNGTPPGTDARHGFSTNHRCDDYFTGLRYRPLQVIAGGRFPDLKPTRDANSQSTGANQSCLTYMRWRFTEPQRFEKGKRYAFMVGIEEPGPNRGFSVANANAAGVKAPPATNDKHDRYHGGWAIRREGDGTLPPTMRPGAQRPEKAAEKTRLINEARFAEGRGRYTLSPTTDGFPDVDTYRDLEFYFEAAR